MDLYVTNDTNTKYLLSKLKHSLAVLVTFTKNLLSSFTGGSQQEARRPQSVSFILMRVSVHYISKNKINTIFF